MADPSAYVGVDTGTGSVRAVLVSKDGKVLASSVENIDTFRDERDHRIFEQSTTNIWQSITRAVKTLLSDTKIEPQNVKGLGFDATCSLAVTDFEGNPIVITNGPSLGEIGQRNVILWADHRAEDEAEQINKTGSIVLDYVGGKISLEMEIPKVLWLKKRMAAEQFSRCQFFDLPDYLTYRATGESTRSCCSLTCKCSFVPEKGWQDSLFQSIGLDEFVQTGYMQMGPSSKVLTAGVPVGRGLSEQAAQELGLLPGTPVGSGVIDAYAGWIGTIAARFPAREGDELSDEPSLDESKCRLAAVAGTSTCFLVQSKQGVSIPGVWGPYKDAVFPGWWMNEGGQSSTGQLIDFIITTHPAYLKLLELAKEESSGIHAVLARELERMRKESGAESFTALTKDLHLYPDFHGNRSPIADPRMCGSIVGMTLDHGISDLARKYNVTLEAIALQTKHIIDEMNSKGHDIRVIYLSGGQVKNKTLMQLFANVCQMPVILPFNVSDSVTLGAAVLGRFASEYSTTSTNGSLLWVIMTQMTPPGTAVVPNASKKERSLLEAKYKIFRESAEIQQRWRREIETAST